MVRCVDAPCATPPSVPAPSSRINGWGSLYPEDVAEGALGVPRPELEARELLPLALGSPEAPHTGSGCSEARRRPQACVEREGGSRFDHRVHYNIVVFLSNRNVH